MSEFLQEYAARYMQRSPTEAPRPASAEAQGPSQGARRGQQASSIFSAIASVSAGASEARSLQRQAGDELLAAAAEETQAQKDVNQIRRMALAADAGRRVAFAASGVDLGSITVQQIGQEDRAIVDEARNDRATDGMRAATRRRRYSRMLANRAAETFGGSLFSAVGDMASSFGGAG